MFCCSAAIATKKKRVYSNIISTNLQQMTKLKVTMCACSEISPDVYDLYLTRKGPRKGQNMSIRMRHR